MKKLVDEKKLRAIFDKWEANWEEYCIQDLNAEEMVDALDNAILDCTLSPAELEDVVNEYVLEQAQKTIVTEEHKSHAERIMQQEVEVRRKAEAWDTLSGIRAETKGKEEFVNEVKEMMQTIWNLQDELLAPSKIEPKEEKGSLNEKPS